MNIFLYKVSKEKALKVLAKIATPTHLVGLGGAFTEDGNAAWCTPVSAKYEEGQLEIATLYSRPVIELLFKLKEEERL
jgi:hypothetical protein